MLNKSIKFEEKVEDEELQTITFYFIAPKEILNDYSDEVSATIGVEVPSNHIEAKYASVSISPTREIDGVLEDCDWRDVDLPYDEIEELLDIAYKAEHSFGLEM